MISIIAAIGKKREIGRANKMLWHIPAEFKHFKQITFGHPIIMGRKTYESIGRPLPGRTPIIITHSNTPGVIRGVRTAQSIEEGIAIAKTCPGNEEIFIIGGASIFAQALPLADKLYLTVVNKTFPEADVFFPAYNEFKKVVSKSQTKEAGYKLTYLQLKR